MQCNEILSRAGYIATMYSPAEGEGPAGEAAGAKNVQCSIV